MAEGDLLVGVSTVSRVHASAHNTLSSVPLPRDDNSSDDAFAVVVVADIVVSFSFFSSLRLRLLLYQTCPLSLSVVLRG
jgi:hypothetical protein